MSNCVEIVTCVETGLKPVSTYANIINIQLSLQYMRGAGGYPAGGSGGVPRLKKSPKTGGYRGLTKTFQSPQIIYNRVCWRIPCHLIMIAARMKNVAAIQPLLPRRFPGSVPFASVRCGLWAMPERSNTGLPARNVGIKAIYYPRKKSTSCCNNATLFFHLSIIRGFLYPKIKTSELSNSYD